MWHSKVTCYGNFLKQNYYYVVEPMQIDQCASINGSDAVQYWRITVRAEKSLHHGAVVVLQEIVGLPYFGKFSGKCEFTPHKLASYVQSWRRVR